MIEANAFQVLFLLAAVYAVVWWAERPAKRKHDRDCDICSRRPR